MNWADWIPLVVAILAAIPGLIAWTTQRKRMTAETEKAEAEADDIHAQTADRWAKRADELQQQIDTLGKAYQARTEALEMAYRAKIEAVERSAREREIGLTAQIEALERQGRLDRAEITGLRLDMQQVRRENETYRLENQDLRDWATALVEQIEKEFKGQPVKMKGSRM